VEGGGLGPPPGGGLGGKGKGSAGGKKVKKLSKEELSKKTDALLEEYLSILDVAEAVKCVTELKTKAYGKQVFYKAVMLTVEMGDKARASLGQVSPLRSSWLTRPFFTGAAPCRLPFFPRDRPVPSSLFPSWPTRAVFPFPLVADPCRLPSFPRG
jgi:hypothetical protein